MRQESEVAVTQKVSSGVAELIQKLHDDGVVSGKTEAGKIIKNAKVSAEGILAQATQEAKTIVAKAQTEAAQIRKGGEDALNIAMRDIVLKLKAKLSETVGERVQKLISADLAQDDFLKKLILEVAGRARDEVNLKEAGKARYLLPKELIGLEELREHPLELAEGSLSHFILNVAADVLREGVTFGEAEDTKPGLRIYLQDKDIQVDLSDERISEILLEHLHPRFRAILEGTVK